MALARFIVVICRITIETSFSLTHVSGSATYEIFDRICAMLNRPNGRGSLLGPGDKLHFVIELRAVAQLFRRTLPRELALLDPSDPTRARILATAAYYRNLVSWVVLSRTDTDKYLREELLTTLLAIVTGRYHELQEGHEMRILVSKGQRARRIVGAVLVAAVPIVALLLIDAFNATLDSEVRTAWVFAAVLWAGCPAIRARSPSWGEDLDDSEFARHFSTSLERVTCSTPWSVVPATRCWEADGVERSLGATVGQAALADRLA
jgi:hypothetical protein